MSNSANLLFLRHVFYLLIVTTLLINLTRMDHCWAGAQSTNYKTSFELSNSAQFEIQRGNKTDNDATNPPPWWSTTASSLPLILAEEHYNFHYGRVIYTQPIVFKSATSSGIVSSFQSYVNFQILRFENYCADGFAFFISPNTSTPYPDPSDWGPAMGLVGYDDLWNATDPKRHLFAVEFDACKNADVGDPSDSHIGIDINGVRSNVTVDTENTINNDLNLLVNHTFHAWVEYHSAIQTVQVWVSTDSSKPPTPILTLPYNLSGVFQDQMYVGLSGINGGSLCTVLVTAWNFSVGEGLPSSSPPAPAQAPGPINITSGDDSGTTPPSGGSTVRKSVVIAATVGVVGVALLICLSVTVCRLAAPRLKRQRNTKSKLGYNDAVRRFSHSDLKRATANFCAERKIGEGGFSTVFKGILADGSVVAVKRLKETVRPREEEFSREAQIISGIRHRNLLQLQGWCYDVGEALLVYPFMERGSLDKYIYSEAKRKELSSHQRLKILEGVAAALEYLHGGLSECVLHRDVKAANVILTEDWEAKLSDFGLARLIEHDETVSVTMAGTPGYTAPEVFMKRRANDKADVYSFGALALELACGRRVGDNLLEWLWSIHESDGSKLTEYALDPVLLTERQANLQKENGGDNQLMSMFDAKWRCVLHLGLLCCSYVPQDRPTMRQALRVLQDSTVLALPATAPAVIRAGFGPDSKLQDVFAPLLLSSSATSSSTATTSGSQSAPPSNVEPR